ncbi:hypothetical protein A3A79_02785 [Candidatus Gottesmanbacteria bacterium RIFCSPLOWO2_01_FULL_43_11b]|uniref:Yip1 domain-containing protein n=1 Tax=Candidatus Gottesmanbacteria bacterium RIFCSPLOWO2_01_FULL_43_11b TaxID=1798392 RepID=A0A1F6AH69_9BACT|nr:MAG: hypothetical protein A3A79_02785 [Candidatus Gottesmanbacteria bacterium RIFCSPLOWO2_01_FULL_43_11b]
MDIAGSLLVGGVSFGRNLVGIITRPYETYRRIVDRGNVWELIPIGLILAFYFSLSSLVKTAAFRPFLLTKQFILLSGGAASGFLLTVAILWGAAWLIGKKARVALAWAYTLIPTVFWFLTTSILSIILPPPRTQSAAGVSFSMLFLIFSVTLLWWKVTLAYLTLRFGLKLDLGRIFAVFAVCVPVWGLWSYFMYKWGIFKVPFL